ncbi:MAG: outer membrane lipoprotein chaperone LolA, partial [Gammaproteobacteria bacterium]
TPQQVSDGRLWILRPGRFRWNYRTPYRQELVADGERLWSYDADLAQVTVQAMDQVFSTTPAMLLGGSAPLDEVFHLEALPAQDGALHARLIPRADDSSVDGIDVYFRDGDLVRLAATDSFGNRTVFAFTNLQRNVAVDPERFRFEPPAGTDIIGDSN